MYCGFSTTTPFRTRSNYSWRHQNKLIFGLRSGYFRVLKKAPPKKTIVGVCLYVCSPKTNWREYIFFFVKPTVFRLSSFRTSLKTEENDWTETAKYSENRSNNKNGSAGKREIGLLYIHYRLRSCKWSNSPHTRSPSITSAYYNK